MWTLICTIVALAAAPSPLPGADEPPVAVFADLDGTWKGTFVGYDAKGVELYRIEVQQTYRTVSDTTQIVSIEDRMADGTVVTAEGENVARRKENGALELRCRVKKSSGDEVEHAGRLVLGPDGDKQIVWYSDAPDRTETFREVVRRENGVDVYEINGMGRYGGMLMLMHGRYEKQKTEG